MTRSEPVSCRYGDRQAKVGLDTGQWKAPDHSAFSSSLETSANRPPVLERSPTGDPVSVSERKRR